MDTVLKSRIRTLEHLGYIIECHALDYAGEAKHELSSLINKIKAGPSLAQDEAVASQLSAALEELMSDKAGGAGRLCSISRGLWSPVMKALEDESSRNG